MRSVETPDGPVAVLDQGSGPVFVAVHGIPGTHADFRYLADKLVAAARVVSIDMPGFGETPLSTNPGRSPNQRASVVAQVLDALDLSDVVLLGHSMGGPVVASAGRLWPERVAGVGLLASIGIKPNRGMRRMPHPWLVRGAMKFGPVRNALLPTLRDGFEKAGFKGWSDDELVHSMRVTSHMDFSAHEDNLRNLGRPTLVAWTEDDGLIEPSISERLYWVSPHGPRIKFEKGGHNLVKSRAQELSEALLAWQKTLITH